MRAIRFLKNFRFPGRQNLGYLFFGFSLALGGAVISAVTPATTPPGCDISQAGEFAIDSNLRMINATTVNPGKYFVPGGTDSCISSAMLQNFDLSSLIPDLWGLVTNGLENAITSAINGTVSAVCNAANGALQSTVGQMNNAIPSINNLLTTPSYSNLLGSNLSFNTFNPQTVISLNGNGSYSPNSVGGSAFGIAGSQPVPVTPGSTGGPNIQNVFNQSNTPAQQAIIAAGNTAQAQIAYNQAVSQYQNNPTAANWNQYNSALNSLNNAITAQNAAQQAATYGTTNTYYNPIPPVQPIQQISSNSSNNNSSGFGNIFGNN